MYLGNSGKLYSTHQRITPPKEQDSRHLYPISNSAEAWCWGWGVEVACVNSLALLACPAAGQSEAEKFPLLPPKKKKKKPLYLEMQILGPCHHEGRGICWSSMVTWIHWAKMDRSKASPYPRQGMSHLWEVLLIGVEQFHRTTKGAGNSILSHHSFSCRFTR